MPARAKNSVNDRQNQGGGKTNSTGQNRRRLPATNVRGRPRLRRKTAGLFASVLELTGMLFLGRVFLVLMVVALLAALNILLSGNQFDLFFRLFGIEMALAAIVFWLRFLLRKD
jgi:hypothetical protein